MVTNYSDILSPLYSELSLFTFKLFNRWRVSDLGIHLVLLKSTLLPFFGQMPSLNQRDIRQGCAKLYFICFVLIGIRSAG